MLGFSLIGVSIQSRKLCVGGGGLEGVGKKKKKNSSLTIKQTPKKPNDTELGSIKVD